MPIKAMLKAKFDFEAQNEEELGFKEGDTLYLLFKDESGWAKGRKITGEKGWFPFEYTELLVDMENGATESQKSQEQQSPSSNGLDSVPQNTSSSGHGSTDSEKSEAPSTPQSKHGSVEPAAAQEKKDISRYYVANEIMTTEKTYVSCLGKIIRLFLGPMKESNLVDQKLIPKIFCNIEPILLVNNKLLSEIELRLSTWSETTTLGDIFVHLLPEFTVYEEYLRSHHAAIVTVNQLCEKKAFAIWLQGVKEQKECEGLDLLAFLIMPVQRILRYKLLLEELNKKTLAEHPDKPNIEEALKNISSIATNANEKLREEDNYNMLVKIQRNFVGHVKNIVVEGRKFIFEGPVMKVCRKTDKPRWFFLFNDALVYASFSSNTKNRGTSTTATLPRAPNHLVKLSDQRYLFHRMVNLHNASVEDVPDNGALKNAFKIVTAEEKSFVVYTETKDEKYLWLKYFNELTTGNELAASAPVWLPDSATKNCMVCNKGFNVVQRRHHCRYCGKIVCGSCSGQNVRIQHISAKPVRVCKPCHDELKELQSSSASLSTSFNLEEDSPELSRAIAVASRPVSVSLATTPNSSLGKKNGANVSSNVQQRSVSTRMIPLNVALGSPPPVAQEKDTPPSNEPPATPTQQTEQPENLSESPRQKPTLKARPTSQIAVTVESVNNRIISVQKQLDEEIRAREKLQKRYDEDVAKLRSDVDRLQEMVNKLMSGK